MHKLIVFIIFLKITEEETQEPQPMKAQSEDDQNTIKKLETTVEVQQKVIH